MHKLELQLTGESNRKRDFSPVEKRKHLNSCGFPHMTCTALGSGEVLNTYGAQAQPERPFGRNISGKIKASADRTIYPW